MNKLPNKIQNIQNELVQLSVEKNFEQVQRVILAVINLLDDSVSTSDLGLFQLFNDADGKIRANATWFYEDRVIADRKATYKVSSENELNIDFKVYGVNKAKKQVISWATALTPNFEDEPFNSKFNIGIDFIVPKSTDRVIIVLTNNYVIRTLELKDELTVTYQEILAKWSDIKDFSNKPAVHTALWESFDLQPLNKKFYAGVSERFITLRQYLVKENILDEKHASMFANRLIGRVIFTWFLDKKGIINPDSRYFDSESFESDTDYYKTKLETLFFGILNTPIDERDYKDEVTPFLNGGLFEARQNDLYKDSKLSFPKNYFDDLFGFLSAYNFTTDESTSQFQQVAIDPEMLGRIFENLLAEIVEETGEQARKAKGAFYTPREIVDYMCKESLKEYLKTKLPEDTYRDQRLYQLIDAPDKDFQDQDHNWRRDWKPYKDAIIYALDDLKVLDPACGSGAFPIGMLQLLVRVYERLEPRFDGYKAKLQIIEKNIYGVDIEPMAVEIARLRTWLSIIVDEESDSKKIKPLPNLEFKFVCANSLTDLDKSGVRTFGDDPNLENKLREIRDAYFKTESLGKKKKLRAEYDKTVSVGGGLFGESEKSKQLKTYRPFDNESSSSFFNSEFMFGLHNFSLVIGNPPYVDYRKIEVSLKRKLINFRVSKYSRMINLYNYFFEIGINNLQQDGILTYISPQQYLILDNCKGLRDILRENNVILLADFARANVFSASTYTFVSMVKKNKSTEPLTYLEFDQINNLSAPIKTLKIQNPIPEPVNISSNGELIEKIELGKKTLGSVSDIFCASSSSALKFTDNVVKGNLFITASDIKNWYAETPSKIVLIDSYSQNSAVKQIDNVIYTSRMTTNIRAVPIFENKYLGGKVNVVKPNDEVGILFITAILNSKLINFWFREKFSMQHMQGGALPINTTELKKIPIIFNKDLVKRIESLSQDIISIKRMDIHNDTINLENQIDELIMDLYSLSEDEKEVVKKASL